jgi:hypothetical protein
MKQTGMGRQESRTQLLPKETPQAEIQSHHTLPLTNYSTSAGSLDRSQIHNLRGMRIYKHPTHFHFRILDLDLEFKQNQSP